MKLQKKILIILITLLLSIFVFASNVFADELENKEYSEAYKKYLELSDEEKSKIRSYT